MGTVTLNKNNRLFWLGRYSERLLQGVQCLRSYQDELLDHETDHRDLQSRMGVAGSFAGGQDFCTRTLFDRDLPDSLTRAADAMLGNGMVLRETLSTTALSYLQMAVTAMDLAANSNASGVELQWVIDDVFAFRGCCFAFVEEEAVRNTIKSGISIERLSLLLRFNADETAVLKELRQLLNRLYKTKLQRDEDKLARLSAYVFGEKTRPARAELLPCVEGLFAV